MEDFDLDDYQPLPVVYELRQSILEKMRNGEEVLQEIDGREKTKRDVIRAILSGANPYLVSEESTGKTRLAKSLTSLLHPIPVIRGCPYHDDPKWTKEWLCSRCAESPDPVEEYGIDFIQPEKRFSRIQGNEYTNYAKVLGLKDINVIREGVSPTDPRAFTGTGVFHGNRGIVFIAELPLIPTNVQVLLHPILEERKVILEEYNLERPIDSILIATGSTEGFAHIDKIPRPLLDRLELIHMDLPNEDEGREIMLKERFKVDLNGHHEILPSKKIFKPNTGLLKRRTIIPWWISDIIVKTVRNSRNSINLDKGASIRGSKKAIDHTCASVEMEDRRVTNLKDASDGLRLALRGRIRIRPDLTDFGENPEESFLKTEEIIEDIMRQAVKESGEKIKMSEELTTEINSLLSKERIEEFLEYEELRGMVDWMCDDSGVNVLDEYRYAALEMIVNAGICGGFVERSKAKRWFFVPEKFKG